MKLFKSSSKETGDASVPEPEPAGNELPVKETPVESAQAEESPAGDTVAAGATSSEPESVKSETASQSVPVEAPQTNDVSSQPQQSAQAAPAPASEPSAAVYVPPRRRSWLYRFLNFLLGADTRLGRIMRPVLRWTAAVVGLFALGLLAGFLLIYQPTQQGLDAANLKISQQKADLDRQQAQMADLQNTLTAANQANQVSQDALKKAQARNGLLVLISDVANARTYLAQKDGAKVMAAMDQARQDLNGIQPYLLANKKELSDELNGRLETVRSVLVRDAQQAQVDLDNLYTALLAANNLLFGSQ